MINQLKKHIEDSNFTDEQKIVFFEVGPKAKYKKVVDPRIINKIETSLFRELKELGYL